MQATVNNFSRYTFVTEEGKLICVNTAGKHVQPKGTAYYLINDAGNKVKLGTQVIIDSLKVSNGLNRFGEAPDYSVKLNRTLAQYIRFRVAVGKVTLTHLANAFNVDLETIAMIVKNQTYKDPAYYVPVKYSKKVKYNPSLLPAVIY